MLVAVGGQFENARSMKTVKSRSGLCQAKANFEKEERCKEHKQLWDKDTWMLPDMKEWTEQFSQEHCEKNSF